MKFRMVDRIEDWTPRQRIRGLKVVSFEEYQLKKRLGDDAALPESLLMESLFQLGGWLMILSSDFTQLGLITRFEEIRFDRRVRPGDLVRMEVEVRSWREEGIVLDGRAIDEEGCQIATGKGCLALPAPLADYHSPGDLRVLFDEIYQPAQAMQNHLEGS